MTHLKFILHIIFIFINNAKAAEVNQNSGQNVFTENFTWAGNHAAYIANASATTVWWDEGSWDVRGDTSFISVVPVNESISNRYHIDIHKAATNNPTDGNLANNLPMVGGNGEAGVAVMHLDYQDILSARLRNPLLISSNSVAKIEFYASAFVTTGHWWEIALTPADSVSPGEYTSVPGQGVFSLPSAFGSGGQPGPGHPNPMESINLVSLGETDVPCSTGWYTRFGITKRHNDISTHFVNIVSSFAELTLTDPQDADKLEHWKLEITPTSMTLFKDANDNNNFTLVESWTIDIPWNEVYVHFLGVAYQSDHHPQQPCFLGHIRELKWRNIKVSPVKYAHTDVYPKNNGTIQVGKQQGWLSYDTRDIQRFGTPINNVPQANTIEFSTYNAGKYCNDAGFPCFGSFSAVDLPFVVPQTPSGMTLASTLILADLKNGNSTPEMPVNVAIDNNPISSFLPAENTPTVLEQAWIRRSVAIPASMLGFSNNPHLNLTLGNNAYLDRIEMEFFYSLTQADLIFANGFD